MTIKFFGMSEVIGSNDTKSVYKEPRLDECGMWHAS
jgi:hypothetical protein